MADYEDRDCGPLAIIGDAQFWSLTVHSGQIQMSALAISVAFELTQFRSKRWLFQRRTQSIKR